MSLTVGTTLQNNKLAIEAILHQTDFGVTYRAAHPAISHPVILQSFNGALRQRSDFDQLRQKFLQEVLLFSKQPSNTVQVIDCFEEDGMPFVVLDATAEQSIPTLSSWLEIPIEAPVEEIAQPKIEASALAVALATAFPEAPPKATAVTAPIAPVPVAEVSIEETPPAATAVIAPIAPVPVAKVSVGEIAIADAEELAPVVTEAVAPDSIPQSLPLGYAMSGSGNGVKLLVSEQSLNRRKWMPLALMMTALITGFGGVGLGLALRVKPTPQGSNASSLDSGWFGQEQSFPPQQEWPITESPNRYAPSPAFEQPLYQPSPSTSPSIRESGIPNVQTPDYIPPAQLTSPAYQPTTPGIADYPPTVPTPIQPTPAAPSDSSVPSAPSAPEAAQPVVPLPQPIIPETSEIAPEPNKPVAPAPKNAPADAPIIFHQ